MRKDFLRPVAAAELGFDVATQAELDAHVAAADPHTVYRLESAAIAAADVAADVATQAELDAAVGLPRALTGAVAATRYVGGTASLAPTTGTFSVGDFVVTSSGRVWVCVTAGSPGTWTQASASRDQLARTASGVISENFHPSATAQVSLAPVSQTVYGILLGLRGGDVVTGVLLRNGVAAAGTLPTLARFGIENSTGQVLALSGDESALAQWPVGANPHPFTAPYTVLADGGYFACFVVNGTWGTTQPTLLRNVGTPLGQTARVGFAPPDFKATAQTDLPAVNASSTITTGIDLGFYMGFY